MLGYRSRASWMQFSPIRGCFSQMFKKGNIIAFIKTIFSAPILFVKNTLFTLLFPPLACNRKAPCKNQSNQFPKLTTLWLLFHSCNNFPNSLSQNRHPPFWGCPLVWTRRYTKQVQHNRRWGWANPRQGDWRVEKDNASGSWSFQPAWQTWYLGRPVRLMVP